MAEPIDKDTRGPVNLRIKFRSESLQQFIERYGVDVSRGGIFIRTREPLPVGTRLKLDFQLVDTAPLFQGDGTVVWIREHDASRAGVTPGMGVRFDRLTAESQTTLDTILEEKIRLQQSGVAPGSIAKAGAGIAVRRLSGAFATLDAQGAKPPPLPIEVKKDTAAAPPVGAAPVSAMPAASARSAPVSGAGSSSIFTRPRATSGMRTVGSPSAVFEAPTAADIDKALSALEEKGGGPPALPVVPMVINRSESRPSSDDDPTKVFDSAATEFSDNEAVTGPATLVPESGIPISTGDGDLTERRAVDPASGDVSDAHMDTTAEFGQKVDGKGRHQKAETPPPPVPGAGKAAAVLDAPLASLVDSGKAPAAQTKLPPVAGAAAKSAAGVPMRITTDRPAATESGRFRSDARYKRKRGNGLYYALAVLLIGGGGAAAAFYVKKERARRAAEAAAAVAAAPPFAAGQGVPLQPAPTTVPGTEAAPATAAGGAAAGPTEPAAAGEVPGKAAKPEEAVAKTEVKPESKPEAAKPEKQGAGKAEKAEKTERSGRRKDRVAAAAAAETAKPAEAAKPAEGDQGGKAAQPPEAAKPAETAKPVEAAKPAEGDQGGKAAQPAEAAKPVEAAPAPAAPAVLKITSSPAGADVVIDGVPVGTTPFSSKEISVDGTHAITVKKDGYESHERMISGSDWARGKGGAQSLKVNIKLKRAGAEPKPAESGEKKEPKQPEVEILTPSEP